MGWDSKRVYPEGTTRTVTVRCTYEQYIAWSDAARKYHKGSTGAFLNWAAKFAIVALNALETTDRPWRAQAD